MIDSVCCNSILLYFCILVFERKRARSAELELSTGRKYWSRQFLVTSHLISRTWWSMKNSVARFAPLVARAHPSFVYYLLFNLRNL